MKLHFTHKHLDRSEALEQYARDRLDELSRFLLKDGFGHVYFSKQQHEFCAEVSVNTREKYFRATAFHEDVYQAVDQMVTKLERQFLKTKNQVQNHKRPELSKGRRHERFSENLEPGVRYKKAA